jgi:hypothetical protein
MFGKQKKAKTPPPPTGNTPDQGALISEGREVHALLAKGSTKSAVELAKQIHKRYGTPASEALVVEAYGARIRSLLEHSLTAEAKALLELVRERYSSAKQSLAEIDIVVSSSEGSLDDLVRPLNDPALPKERRAAIENAIKRRLTDLSALAQCAVLPADHPLRVGATALGEALASVTSGPVTDAALLLPHVSHRGPLAPWKQLVRAIAYFYRQEDVACDRCLQGIDPESVPARLVSAMRAMLAERRDASLGAASAALVTQVGGSREALRRALESLDAAFASKTQSKIIPAIQPAISACRIACPELVGRLRQHISIRAVNLNLPVRRVQAALGGPSIKDAYFWRLYARGVETSSEPLGPIACSLWEEFRRHAVAEGWFREDGLEAAVLYLHMAELLQEMPGEELSGARRSFMESFPGYSFYYEDQPPAIRAAASKHRTSDFYYLFPDQLFTRACALDPDREAFERWLDWARQESDEKAAERVAESWHRALPNDSRPLLYLMESAEKRGALNKATGFLDQAEKLDALNPEVRRAALRLLVAQAIRHLRQHKAHLAEQELASLEALPQAQEADRPAFLAALRWICSVIRGDAETASGYFTQVSRMLGGPAAAILTCGSMAEACGLKRDGFGLYLPPGVSLADEGDSLAAAVGRACALGEDMDVVFTIPTAWESALFKELSHQPSRLEARQLRALGEAALHRDRRELAYAASAAGLAKGGDSEARFLLLRAQALPEWEFERRADCIAAAAELGRRRRDMALVDEAVELKRGRGKRRMDFLDWLVSADEDAFSMSTEQISTVLKREKQSSRLPAYKPAQSHDPFEEDAFFDDEDAEEANHEPTLGDIARLLVEMAEAELKKKRHQKGRRNLPEQGDLFE